MFCVCVCCRDPGDCLFLVCSVAIPATVFPLCPCGLAPLVSRWVSGLGWEAFKRRSPGLRGRSGQKEFWPMRSRLMAERSGFASSVRRPMCGRGGVAGTTSPRVCKANTSRRCMRRIENGTLVRDLSWRSERPRKRSLCVCCKKSKGRGQTFSLSTRKYKRGHRSYKDLQDKKKHCLKEACASEQEKQKLDEDMAELRARFQALSEKSGESRRAASEVSGREDSDLASWRGKARRLCVTVKRMLFGSNDVGQFFALRETQTASFVH